MKFDITAAALAASRYRPLHAGDDYDYTFTVKNRAGVAINLTGGYLWFTVKSKKLDPDSDAVIAYTTEDNTQISITSPAAGIFVIHFDGTDTQDLAGTWQYDIKAKLSSRVIHLAYGTIEFLHSITQDRT